ncbi:18812_t:CDS:1, partial [Funneliformis geosporum]
GQHKYIGITAHWISNEFIMQEAFLAFQYVEYPHTGEVIKEKLEDIINNWNINHKVSFITTGNAGKILNYTNITHI